MVQRIQKGFSFAVGRTKNTKMETAATKEHMFTKRAGHRGAVNDWIAGNETISRVFMILEHYYDAHVGTWVSMILKEKTFKIPPGGKTGNRLHESKEGSCTVQFTWLSRKMIKTLEKILMVLRKDFNVKAYGFRRAEKQGIWIRKNVPMTLGKKYAEKTSAQGNVCLGKGKTIRQSTA